ncbi:phosphoenolpyruvate carboxylase-like [Prosopis cineraria]|uniref:phosphoenolpyruvate carboxylase-like n=1 Tax=Prosopis cineraria TaxID=364024 RepID=UPI00240F646F|nr:phosphoenolpyruvate carboxylase-like [Prosopis cineraria]
MGSIDTPTRLLALPGDLCDYDALLMDQFLNVLQDLHGKDITQTVQDCYELSSEYEEEHDPDKLKQLENKLTGLDAGDSIMVAKSFSHKLNLANLAEEVQMAYQRKTELIENCDSDDENTESDIERTFNKLVKKKTPQEVFDALKNQTVDLVLTAHPTPSVRS